MIHKNVANFWVPRWQFGGQFVGRFGGWFGGRFSGQSWDQFQGQFQWHFFSQFVEKLVNYLLIFFDNVFHNLGDDFKGKILCNFMRDSGTILGAILLSISLTICRQFQDNFVIFVNNCATIFSVLSNILDLNINETVIKGQLV